jgi:hypothetical protein
VTWISIFYVRRHLEITQPSLWTRSKIPTTNVGKNEVEPMLNHEPGCLSRYSDWGRGVKLTTHLRLVPRSKNAWSYTSTPQYGFIAWCSVKKSTGTTLTFNKHTESATGWTIGVLGFVSRRGLGIFLFTIASRPALGPTQPPTQWEPGALSLGVKRLVREAHHSPLSSAEVKECVELYLHSLKRLHGVVLS